MLIDIIKQLIKTNKKINKSELSRNYKVDRKTISKLINNLKNDENFEYKRNVKKPLLNQIDIFIDIIKEKLNEPKIKIQTIYDFLKRDFGIKFSYQYFSLYLRKNNLKTKVSKKEIMTRIETPPAYQAQVDWKENIKLKLKNGNVVVFNVFVMILSFSRKVKFIFALDKTQETVFKCILQSLNSFKIVPEEILFDNMKTVVNGINKNIGETEINEKFRQFAKDVGFNIYSCAIRRPQTKGKVEAAVKKVGAIKVYDGFCNSIDEIIQKLQIIEDEINNKKSRATNLEPNYYHPFEIQASNFRIKTPYDLNNIFNSKSLYLIRKVDSTGFISYKSNYYSVPYNYRNKKVFVKEINKILIIEDEFSLICTHNVLEKIGNKTSYHLNHLKENLNHFNKGSTKKTIDQIIKLNIEAYKAKAIIDKGEKNE